MSGLTPSDGDWIGATTRVAGIYGANASGKSTVLHALDFMIRAVASSAVRWGSFSGFPHYPFALSTETLRSPSTYEVDFLLKGVRYTYGFTSDSERVRSEWLHSFPTGRRRLLFERTTIDAETKIAFGRTLTGENATISKLVRPNALFLSVAANNNHPILGPIQHHISAHTRYARFDERDRQDRLRWVRTLLEDKDLLEQTESLLRLADLGITGVALEIEDMTDELRQKLAMFLSQVNEAFNLDDQEIESALDSIQKKIRFAHGDEEGNSFDLKLEDESSGTVAWLTLAVPALIALKYGDVFLVDEIDSSLHPKLTASLITIFKDPEINKSGAQLVFTSHDTALLGSLVGNLLSAEEIWFTDKLPTGATELYALQEFPTRKTDNFEKRYLQGRYGAIPMIDENELRSALAS